MSTDLTGLFNDLIHGSGKLFFFCKGPDSEYFRLVGHMVSVTNTQCYSSENAARDNT